MSNLNRNLTSLIDFVKEINEERTANDFKGHISEAFDLWVKTMNRANFLDRDLEYWMVAPCDSEGNEIEEPDRCYSAEHLNLVKCAGYKVGDCECVEYQKAKDRMLFDCGDAKIHEGDSGVWVNGVLCRKIKELVEFKPLLTDAALKELGYENITST